MVSHQLYTYNGFRHISWYALDKRGAGDYNNSREYEVEESEAQDTSIHREDRAGDTLLILGDEENGILVTKPEVLNDVAQRIFQNLDKERDE